LTNAKAMLVHTESTFELTGTGSSVVDVTNEGSETPYHQP